MDAQEIYLLGEQVAGSVQRGEIGTDYEDVNAEMIRLKWGLDRSQQREVYRLAVRGRIAADPAEAAVMADDPEWAAAVRLVLEMCENAKRQTLAD